MKKLIITALVIILYSGLGFAQYVKYDNAIKMLSKVKKTDYPEADEISINNTKIHLDKHCLGTYLYDNYEKILTEKAKKDKSTVRFWYNDMYDTAIVKTIEIIKSDGKKVSFDPYTILKLKQNTFAQSVNIYSEEGWVLTAELPGLEVGDIIHTEEMDSSFNNAMANNYFDIINVEHYSPVLKEYFELSTPKKIKLNIHYINKKEGYVDFAEKTKKRRKVYTWNISCAPQIIYEPNMEDINQFAYYIALTTVDSWEQLSRWNYSLIAPHLKTNKAMKDKVDELVKDAKTKKDSISKIFYWVAQNIRYLGVDKEKNRPGLEPHDVVYTFSTQGGVCRDKAALLVAMLRLAKIPSDPIVFASGYKLSPLAPGDWFNHLVALSYDKNGKPEYFFDPTDENTKDFFPQYQEDCSYIIASKKGNTLGVVPLSPASRNNTAITINIKVDSNNTADCSMKMKYSGLGDNALRGYLVRINPQKKEELVNQLIAKIHPLAELKNYTITNPRNINQNITFFANFTIPNYIDKENNYVYIPLEATKLTLSLLYNYQLNALNMSARRYPFKLPNTFSIDINENLILPFALNKLSLPEIPTLKAKGFKLTQKHSLNANKLSYTTHFSINKIHFAQKDFIPLKTELSKLSQIEKLYMIGEK